LIIGGGIAGLWLLDELSRRNYSVLLIECDSLGNGQTVWSQGIIHGGLKYSLSGLLSSSAEAIRDMPSVWRECLAGTSEPNLSGETVISPCCYLWRTQSISSRFGMIGAQIGLRVAPVALAPPDRPAALRGCPGMVARLDEQVIDARAVLDTFRRRNEPRIMQAHVTAIERTSGSVRMTAKHPIDSRELHIEASRLILTAGNGTPELRKLAGLPANKTQVRPLHMAMIRGEESVLPELNGHCVDGAKTRLTITTMRDGSGRRVWLIGGELAEVGAGMKPEALLHHARHELHATIPNVVNPGCAWSTYLAPRAESAMGGRRPDDAAAIEDGLIISAWPTKLTLAPRLADVVRAMLPPPSGETSIHSELEGWPKPLVALPPWEIAARWWNDEEISG